MFHILLFRNLNFNHLCPLALSQAFPKILNVIPRLKPLFDAWSESVSFPCYDNSLSSSLLILDSESLFKVSEEFKLLGNTAYQRAA